MVVLLKFLILDFQHCLHYFNFVFFVYACLHYMNCTILCACHKSEFCDVAHRQLQNVLRLKFVMLHIENLKVTQCDL
jgi:hypothetical protein